MERSSLRTFKKENIALCSIHRQLLTLSKLLFKYQSDRCEMKLNFFIELSKAECLFCKKKKFFNQSITMGKFQNFELNEEQRQIQMLRHQRRLELRQKFWKNITDPHKHSTGEGGALVRN